MAKRMRVLAVPSGTPCRVATSTWLILPKKAKVNASSCSGTENAASLLLDYKLSKRFDTYFGGFWSGVQDGLANGYINKDNIATTLGVRFKF